MAAIGAGRKLDSHVGSFRFAPIPDIPGTVRFGPSRQFLWVPSQNKLNKCLRVARKKDARGSLNRLAPVTTKSRAPCDLDHRQSVLKPLYRAARNPRRRLSVGRRFARAIR